MHQFGCCRGLSRSVDSEQEDNARSVGRLGADNLLTGASVAGLVEYGSDPARQEFSQIGL